MGIIQDQISTILADGSIDDNERKKRIYSTKVDALISEMRNGSVDGAGRFLEKTFTYNGLDIVCHAVGFTVDPNRPKRLVMDLSITSNGETRRNTYYVTNPPIAGTDKQENPLKAIGDMITSWVNW